MFAKNLIYLHEILKEEEDNDERCRYFNFWITDHVKKKLKTEWNDHRYITSILSGFYGVENLIRASTHNNNCHFDYKSNVDLDLWKERKDLHDYIRNYDYINGRINSNGEFCTLYSKYFVYIKRIHDKYKSDCCNGSSNKCPHLIDLNYFCNNDSLFNKVKCDEKKGISETSSGGERSQSMEGHDGSGKSHAVPSSLPQDDQNGTGDIIINNTDYYAKLGVSLSFLGILSTFFYLYNFTTFGDLIRSKVLKKGINVNLDEYSQNLMTHELNHGDENIYSDGYNVTYQPS
ncbi:PIR Superfamily Protein [Plasmodium ovale wallikeri]|uniref:PIR Superfamily Protein n=1 Tax=Plasmodium ovale wallikeri TaxID=864142 RepID=A0A1A9AS75_PLAOA|nr:PIR Superfamily Protein [Plasmodium ovale wallikeri]